jgi:hypothetical protein
LTSPTAPAHPPQQLAHSIVALSLFQPSLNAERKGGTWHSHQTVYTGMPKGEKKSRRWMDRTGTQTSPKRHSIKKHTPARFSSILRFQRTLTTLSVIWRAFGAISCLQKKSSQLAGIFKKTKPLFLSGRSFSWPFFFLKKYYRLLSLIFLRFILLLWCCCCTVYACVCVHIFFVSALLLFFFRVGGWVRTARWHDWFDWRKEDRWW